MCEAESTRSSIHGLNPWMNSSDYSTASNDPLPNHIHGYLPRVGVANLLVGPPYAFWTMTV
jgi:hypothetical protein